MGVSESGRAAWAGTPAKASLARSGGRPRPLHSRAPPASRWRPVRVPHFLLNLWWGERPREPPPGAPSSRRHVAGPFPPSRRDASAPGRDAFHSPPDESEIRIPKNRKKSELRTPKESTRTREQTDDASSPVIIRPSGFGFLSALGFRPSEFTLTHAPPTAAGNLKLRT